MLLITDSGGTVLRITQTNNVRAAFELCRDDIRVIHDYDHRRPNPKVGDVWTPTDLTKTIWDGVRPTVEFRPRDVVLHRSNLTLHTVAIVQGPDGQYLRDDMNWLHRSECILVHRPL